MTASAFIDKIAEAAFAHNLAEYEKTNPKPANVTDTEWELLGEWSTQPETVRDHWRDAVRFMLTQMREPPASVLAAICTEAKKEQLRPIEVHLTDASLFWRAGVEELLRG